MRAVLNIVWLILCSGLGLACLAVAFAAFSKSHDVVIVSNGFARDYLNLGMLMGVFGVAFVAIVLFGVVRMARRPKPPKPDRHF